MARKMSAPTLSLSQAVPAGPTAAIRSTDRAELSWTESMAATASPHGGTGTLLGTRWLTAGPLGQPVTDRAYPGVDEHVSLLHWTVVAGGYQAAGDPDVGTEPGQPGEPGPRLRRGAPRRSWVRARRG